jgi:predicted helicase
MKILNGKNIKPNEYYDWISKRSNVFETLFPLAPDKKFELNSKSIFITYSLGIASSRDSWVYNFSNAELFNNMSEMIKFYNSQRILLRDEFLKNKIITVDDFVSHDSSKISWNDSLKEKCKKKCSS